MASPNSSAPVPVGAELNLTPVTEEAKKPAPMVSKFGLVAQYSPSADGVDENILILFHGFGDTHFQFANLGRALKLPQTATLAVRGTEPIPYLLPEDPPAFQYFPIYTLLGEPITAPNPTAILGSLISMLKHLVDDCKWPESRIHLFGFGQGGSVAIELARLWAREQTDTETVSPNEQDVPALARTGVLGSIVTVSGPLLSHPTPHTKSCPTPLLIVHRPPSSESALTAADIRALKKAFNGRRVVEEIAGSGKEGMPTSRDEWMGVMRFWADVLERRVAGEGIYRVG
ncbi:hypothetical protein M408DRAFT_329369 [Serendipita vermifera MAFF 305830]|uniref:Phospholipase/carboxylesterase/thioesterase domain-containing protein n=1 Tax=Serendipita vermifera MAFF 305830 TaxID=933852 RepID=A0A0C3AVS2_SERVB|nr:hypothetical protein M408DRAFT_329369 [Serendipita vermifera MAFF 305830]